MAQPLWRTVSKFLMKLKIELPYYPVISHLGIFFKKMQNTHLKIYMHPIFIAALFTIAKIYNQLITEYYSAMKKENISPFVTIWVDLECIMQVK